MRNGEEPSPQLSLDIQVPMAPPDLNASGSKYYPDGYPEGYPQGSSGKVVIEVRTHTRTLPRRGGKAIANDPIPGDPRPSPERNRAPRRAPRRVPRHANSRTTVYPVKIEAAFAAGSDTSEAAAASIKRDLGRMQKMVLESLRRSGPATQHELSSRLDLLHSTVCGRVNELVQIGLVADSGDRRLSPSGRPAAVWQAVDETLVQEAVL